ncbi:major histocompatibility complex class I-related gene protein-like [Acanthopagrus latus]|uniref:major histocompatibility complex class I-related gene protein-like n=1 Tax=Acanthopagrus latus TaxID=8177 RepID=UPI00187CD6C0|nr:major histocompatibility complex class I-related gene protein-like [Acanthopagrus latus]
MRTLLLLLLFCHLSSPAQHSMKHFATVSTGIPNLPGFMSTAEVDELLVGYCDSNNRVEVKHDWVKKTLKVHPELLAFYRQRCFQDLSGTLKSYTNILMSLNSQSGGVHVVQRVDGCEWDDETEEVKGFVQFGYDGEDFMALDPNTFTWIALRPDAVDITLRLDADKDNKRYLKIAVTLFCSDWLKKYVKYGRSFLLRTELPSVSLLQKTPSSPVSCLATGFYPHRASLFWRKDGEELHEEVDHGEILPNHDETFQMSVDLNLSSVTPENWTRYDCVFQLSGVKEEIITKLEKDRIRTNWVKPSNMTVLVTAAVVVLALILIGAAGFIIYKKMKAISPPSSPDNSTELSEQLNPET